MFEEAVSVGGQKEYIQSWFVRPQANHAWEIYFFFISSPTPFHGRTFISNFVLGIWYLQAYITTCYNTSIHMWLHYNTTAFSQAPQHGGKV